MFECFSLATCYALARARRILVEKEGGNFAWHFYDEAVQSLVADLINCTDASLQNSLVTGVGELVRFAPLPIPSGDSAQIELENSEKDSEKVSKSSGEKKDLCVVQLFLTLRKIYENHKLASKIREQAVQTAGYLCMGACIDIKSSIMKNLLKLAESSSELEMHFSVGDALVDCVLGPKSESALDSWTESQSIVADESVESMETDENLTSENLEEASMGWLLNTILKDHVTKTKPSIRQASCLWLLTLVKRCRGFPQLQRRLPSIQNAFMDLLNDKSEIVQDAASKVIIRIRFLLKPSRLSLGPLRDYKYV